MGNRRHRAVGIHHQIPQRHCFSRLQFHPGALGAVLLWDFFIRVMQGVTMAFFEDVWSRNFLNIFATPLSISEYIAGLVLSAIADQFRGIGSDAGVGEPGFRTVVSGVWRAANPIPAGAVSIRHRTRHFRVRDGAPIRAGIGMADLANSGRIVAVRRGLLSVSTLQGGCG